VTESRVKPDTPTSKTTVMIGGEDARALAQTLVETAARFARIRDDLTSVVKRLEKEMEVVEDPVSSWRLGMIKKIVRAKITWLVLFVAVLVGFGIWFTPTIAKHVADGQTPLSSKVASVPVQKAAPIPAAVAPTSPATVLAAIPVPTSALPVSPSWATTEQNECTPREELVKGLSAGTMAERLHLRDKAYADNGWEWDNKVTPPKWVCTRK